MRALRKFYYEHELVFTKLYYFLTKPYHWYKWNFIQKPSCDRFIAKCDEDKRYSLIHDGEIYDLKLKYKDRYVEDFIRPLIDEHNPQLWFDYYFEAEREASCLCFEGTTEEESTTRREAGARRVSRDVIFYQSQGHRRSLSESQARERRRATHEGVRAAARS